MAIADPMPPSVQPVMRTDLLDDIMEVVKDAASKALPREPSRILGFEHLKILYNLVFAYNA